MRLDFPSHSISRVQSVTESFSLNRAIVVCVLYAAFDRERAHVRVWALLGFASVYFAHFFGLLLQGEAYPEVLVILLFKAF